MEGRVWRWQDVFERSIQHMWEGARVHKVPTLNSQAHCLLAKLPWVEEAFQMASSYLL